MKTLAFELVPVDGLQNDELKEMANLYAEKCQKAAQQTIRDAATAGTALNEMKDRVPHGEWRAWLGSNFDYSYRTAWSYMTLAANVKRFTFEPESIREAMKLISEQPADDSDQSPIVPRTERKTGQVKVEKPSVMPTDEDPHAHHEADLDPNPAQKTSTKHSTATAKVKEADRPAPMPVTPEIVEDQAESVGYDRQAWDDLPEQKTLSDFSLDEIFEFIADVAEGDVKNIVKRLRKLADKLDPPAVGAPNLEAVQEWAHTNGYTDFDADKFFNHYTLSGWKYGKAKTPIKDWKRAAANAYSGGNGWAVDGANRLPF